MEDFVKSAKVLMDKAIKFLQEEYKLIKVGRANPKILDKVFIEYYGSKTLVNQLLATSVEGRSLVLKPWDNSLLKEIERALQRENLGVTPQSDGEKIRMNFPPLSEEERLKVSKEVSKLAEETKVTIRNARRDVISKINNSKKAKEINDDDAKKFEKKIQELTNSYNNKIDNMCESKRNEVMEV
jgi:ribosome recycling factor